MRNDGKSWIKLLWVLGLSMILVFVQHANASVSATEGLPRRTVEADTPMSVLAAGYAPDTDWSKVLYGVAVQGNYAYVGQDKYLVILDISNPNLPTYAGQSVDLGDTVFDIAVSGNYAYVARVSEIVCNRKLNIV